MQRLLLGVTFLLFFGLSAVAVWFHGYLGIFLPLLQSFAGGQVFADLVIALALFLVWMWRDAKTRGRNPWPWILLTCTTGSFGPLLYLLTNKERSNIAE